MLNRISKLFTNSKTQFLWGSIPTSPHLILPSSAGGGLSRNSFIPSACASHVRWQCALEFIWGRCSLWKRSDAEFGACRSSALDRCFASQCVSRNKAIICFALASVRFKQFSTSCLIIPMLNSYKAYTFILIITLSRSASGSPCAQSLSCGIRI